VTMRIKPWVRGLAVYEPGRPIEEVARERGFSDASELIKLASNENALGPSRKALRAMRQAVGQMHRYPDGGAFYLREALGRRLNLSPDRIAVGHGSNELIALIGHAFLEPGTSIVMADRAFSVYRLVARLYQADVIEVPMREFVHDLDAMLAAVRPDTRLIFVANPNNPTGTAVAPRALDRFLERLPSGVAAVLDEAYVELLPPRQQPDSVRYVREGRDVFVLRTFSKAYGLAGLRIGYALAPVEGVAALHRVRQPFNVNAMALAAALAALDDEAHLRRTRRMVARGLRQLEAGFDALGLHWTPSAVNFVLVEVGAGRRVCEAMERRGVIVRPMDAYGLPRHVRITVGTPSENERLLRALSEALREHGTEERGR